MGCPHFDRRRDSGPTRRDFLRTAIAIGGTSAMAACLEQEEALELPELPPGEDDPSTLPERQHSWGAYMLDDEHGNPKFPEHQVFVFMDYVGDVPPTTADREMVEAALQSVERAYAWGTRGHPRHDAFFHPGVLFTISYAPRYFDRFEEQLPDEIDLQTPEAILEAVDEDVEKADDYDAMIHIAADYPSVLLGVEEALFGNLDELNGITVEGSFEGIFEKRERRPGFVGRGLPSEHLDVEGIPEDAAISMGFKSALLDNLPSEDKITIEDGAYAGGTIQHVSQLRIQLEEWYAQPDEDRIHRMFSPEHTLSQVGATGEMLAVDSGLDEALAQRTVEHARTERLVGHSQKLARIRDEDFDPLILRRGDFNAADPEGSILHFGAIQRTTEDLIRTLQAMKDVGFEEEEQPDVDRRNDGILHFIDTLSRANFLLPSRRLRSLPVPDPE